MRFGYIGGMIGAAFYAAQAVTLGGGLAASIVGGEDAGRAWLGWTVPPMIALGMVLFFGLPAVGAVMSFWRLVTDKEYGDA